MKVSPVCLGVVGSPEVVSEAWRAGINFFFLTADMHWPYYQAAREGLERLFRDSPKARREVVVAATAYVTQPEFCEMPFEEVVGSVSGLGHLDVLVAGGSYGHNLGERLPIYWGHRRERFLGCRAIAASFHDRMAARWAVESSAVDLAFVRFNAGHPGAARDLFPFLPEHRRTRVFNFSSTSGWVSPANVRRLGNPLGWSPRVSDHYRLALSQPGVDGVLVSLHDRSQLEELVAAVVAGPLSTEQARQLIQLAAAARG